MIPPYPYSQQDIEIKPIVERSVIWEVMNYTATAITIATLNTLFQLFMYYGPNVKPPELIFYSTFGINLFCNLTLFSFFYFMSEEEKPTND